MVEAPLALQQSLTIPADHLAACAANSPATPTTGNAAGNTVNLLDLSGEPSPPAPLPDGFTARGIVALVFSCIAGILGVAVVAWYGMVGDPGSAAAAQGSAGVGAAGAVGGSLLQPAADVQEVGVTSGGGKGAVRT